MGTEKSAFAGISTTRFIVGVVLVVVAAILLAQEWVRPTETVRGAKIGTSSNQSAPLVVRWGVDDNLVETGSSIKLWFQFLNQSTEAIGDIRVTEFTAPGFSRADPCWLNGQTPSCAANRSPVNWPVSLPPHSSLILEAPLAGSEAGRYNLGAVYSWNASGAEVRDAVSLGPIEVASAFQIWTTNLSGRLAGIIVPLSLLIAGLYLNLYQANYEEGRRAAEKKRDEDRAQAEKDRDAERRRDEQQYDATSRGEENERARDAAVLNTLLLQQMHDTKKIYLPLSSKGNKLVTDLTKWQEKPGSADLANEIAYDVALWWRLQKHMIDEQGGFHLQSRAGEKVIQECWRVFKKDLIDRITRPVLEAANALPRDLDVTTFNTRRDMDALKKAVQEWLNDQSQPMTAQLPVLKVLRAVLGFEMNRPFERWYGEEQLVFPAKDLKELRADAPGAVHQFLDVYIEKYAEAAPAATTAKPARV